MRLGTKFPCCGNGTVRAVKRNVLMGKGSSNGTMTFDPLDHISRSLPSKNCSRSSPVRDVSFHFGESARPSTSTVLSNNQDIIEYNEDMGRYYCVVCDYSDMLSKEDVKNHCQFLIHQMRVREIREAQVAIQANALKATEKHRRIKKLGSHKWRGILYEKVFQNLEDAATEKGDIHFDDDVELLLRKYEHLERISLLELAVWKAACKSYAGEKEISEVAIKTLDQASWFIESRKDCWRKYRQEMRHSNSIVIVIKHVLPYLGKP